MNAPVAPTRGRLSRPFSPHQVFCYERYSLDGVIASVDAVHADQQMDQFTITQSQVGYADRILLTKTDALPATPKSCVNGWRALTRGR
ncbi:hypothetical protein MJ588_04050 [Klebsiella pneumoniae]|nr:hypothetical protein MJ588_04050 [Klebsiella pneumoniae]